MSAQTEYSKNLAKGYPGLIFAQNPSDIVSRLVETVNGIPFGVAAGVGTDAERQVIAGGAIFAGITIRSLDKEGAANTGAIQWNVTEAAGIMRMGYVWAECPAGCNAGDAVKYVNATGALNAGAAGAGETQLDEAIWDSKAVAGEIAVIRLSGMSTTAGA